MGGASHVGVGWVHFEQQATREKKAAKLHYVRMDDGTSKYAIERPEPAGGERLVLLRAPCTVQCNSCTSCLVRSESSSVVGDDDGGIWAVDVMRQRGGRGAHKNF